MELGLSGKVAWVNGASSGLGKACAAALASEGASVAISSRDPERLSSAAADIRAATGSEILQVPCDVSDADAIRQASEEISSELGSPDILICNSGGPPAGDFETLGDDDAQRAFELLTLSAWRLTKAVVPGMRAKGGGVIEYITSSSTKEIIPGLILSTMMRSAVVGMAKTLSKELAADGIRVVCITPGRIETPRVLHLDEVHAERSGTSPEEVRAASEAAIAAGRYGRTEEFGEVAAFLASERASYISGTSVVVDGGLLNGILT